MRRRKNSLIKVLNNGEITAAITVHAHKFSKTAKEAIEKAGGKAVLIGGEEEAAGLSRGSEPQAASAGLRLSLFARDARGFRIVVLHGFDVQGL